MSRKNRLLTAAAGAASSAIALAMVPTAAQAATPGAHPDTSCYASSCTGLAAASTTCVDDAEIIYTTDIYDGSTLVGNIELKYSPSCRTTWARVASKYDYGGWARIQSNNSETLYEYCEGSTGCNTDMIDDANLTSYATGLVFVDSSGDSASATTNSF
jgi:hypothetical protein